MTLEWPSEKLRFQPKPTGIRKFIRIPYLFHFPYFSGTMLDFKLAIYNDAEEKQDIYYSGSLFRLSGVARQSADFIKQTEGEVEIGPKSKEEKQLHFTHLPQPGNYSLKLHVGTRGENPQNGEGDVVYFDALPKDATAFNVVTVIISGLIGVIIGLVLGG